MSKIRLKLSWTSEFSQRHSLALQPSTGIKGTSRYAYESDPEREVGFGGLGGPCRRIKKLPLESALEGRVTEECLSLYTVDGSLCKTMKSNLLDQFNLDPAAQEPDYYVSIVDMGMIWWPATPTSKDREAKKRACSEYCWSDNLEKICKIIFSHHVNACPYVIHINKGMTFLSAS